MIAETAGGGPTGATGTVREYIWLPETEIAPTMSSRTVVDRPLAVVENVNTASPVTYWASVDHLNRPIQMFNAAKASVWQATWLPWGGVQAITGTATLNARFPGQWFQSETGLHYNWHRSYDPTLGRYTQPDPLGFADGPSVYGYAKGSPHRFVDFNGQQTIDPPSPTPSSGPSCPVPDDEPCQENTFHRYPQNDAEYDLIISTQMVCGQQGRMGRGICARAYWGPLPFSDRGIEFKTKVCPSNSRMPVFGPGSTAEWCLGSPGVRGTILSSMACIPVKVTNVSR